MMTDFSEAYARRLLLGVARYAHDIGEAWTLCRLTTTVRDKYGIDAVADYAVKFQADAIIGQFYQTDNINVFSDHGIIPVAQEFKTRFPGIINITGDHAKAGRVGAEYFINKGFHNFAFLGLTDVIWSQDRLEAFRNVIQNTPNVNSFSELLRMAPVIQLVLFM